MDFFGHGLWSFIIFNRHKPWFAILFGVLPDVISWVPFFFWNLFGGRFARGPPNLDMFPAWVDPLYGVGHSIILIAIVFIIVYIIAKKIPIYMYAWPLHVLIDIPTHTRDFLPTPFLWPFSEWTFPGISWGNAWFMIINYSLIIIGLAYVIFNGRKNRKTKRKTRSPSTEATK